MLSSHAIAVAIKGDHVSEFVKWFNSTKQNFDLDAVLNDGIKARNAAKSSRRTQVRIHGKQNARPVD